VGNDAAADFAAELDGHRRWAVVKAALTHATKAGPTLDSDDAAVAIAAAEVVAHGLGRPTQDDVSTESIQRFVARTRRPSERLAGLASRAVAVAASEDGELAELWTEAGPSEWRDAVGRLVTNLSVR